MAPIFYPVLPLRDIVVFPSLVVPLFVGRETSIQALDAAAGLHDGLIILVAQQDPELEEPHLADLHQVGTLGRILQLLKLPDGSVKVLIEGQRRVRIRHDAPQEEGSSRFQGVNYYTAAIEESPLPGNTASNSEEWKPLTQELLEQFEQYLKLNRKLPTELLASVSSIDDSERLCDTIAAHMPLDLEQKQALLELFDPVKRLHTLLEYIEQQAQQQQMDKKIRTRVKKQMEESQKAYYLNEQLKAINKELGEMEHAPADESEELLNAINRSGMPAEVHQKACSELDKLKSMPPMSAESTIVRNYLDTLIALPWKKRSKLRLDLHYAQTVLDRDHYGLEKVKERIVEFLAVQKRVKQPKGPILCLVGPPGVGKTSLGRSVAASMGREFARIALGGLRDEAEIRGHRRTYIGSMPGKILQKMIKVKVKNPLILLDEVDKMAMDFRGDPASALLEVLDPEQNHAFNDHYLEVDYDLSDVLFIATANSLDIPPALLDRMEVIRLAGYTEDEKRHIALQHIVPKQIKENGLKPEECVFTEAGIVHIIRYYTREAGVRGLERSVSKVLRKVLREILETKPTKEALPIAIDSSAVERYLGVQQYRYGMVEENDRIGQVNGLAWTEVGGELLHIEAVALPGKGAIVQTGHLGDVMKESIQAAMTVVRSRSEQWAVPANFYEKWDMHIHVPEGATPKDGPSAGIGMCTAMLSAITRIPVRSSVAMTGEITLRGEVLPIGGLKEKLLAAHRSGIKTVLIPSENEKDLSEVAENIRTALHIVPVRWIDEVLQLALTAMPVLRENDESVVEVLGTDPLVRERAGGEAERKGEMRH